MTKFQDKRSLQSDSLLWKKGGGVREVSCIEPFCSEATKKNEGLFYEGGHFAIHISLPNAEKVLSFKLLGRLVVKPS